MSNQTEDINEKMGVERSIDKLMNSEACLARHSKAETKAWTKKKTCQLGKVMKQNNEKELFREKEGWCVCWVADKFSFGCDELESQ